MGTNLVHKDAKISSDSLIGPNSVIHKSAIIEKGCRVKHSVIMDDTKLGLSVHVFNSILMNGITVGNYSRIQN